MTTHHQALQQCQAFSNRSRLIRAAHVLVTPQLFLIVDEVLPGNIGVMVIVDDHTPLIWLDPHMTCAFDAAVVQAAHGFGTPEHIGARIDRVTQCTQKHRIFRC